MDIAAVSFWEVAMETVTHEKVIEGEHGSCSTLCEKGNRKRERYSNREREREGGKDLRLDKGK